MKHGEIPYKIFLTESEMPSAWYNLRADMKQKPAPLLHPVTHLPMTQKDLSAVFCEELAKQELDETTPYIPIPTEIRDFYRMYRPSPLVRAYCLEKKLNTPAKIYYKFEGNNTSGSHKLNSAIAQAYYAKKQGLEREEEVRVELQKLIDEYNQGAPAYKKIYSLIIREKEFEKTASRKIKRY